MAVISPWRTTGSEFDSLEGVYSPAEFGGDPTGTEDSTEAIQAAIDAAAAVRGTVHFGPASSRWVYSSQIHGADHIRLTSSAGGPGGQSDSSNVGAGPELRYMGTGTTAAFSMLNNVRWEMDHLRFTYVDREFEGVLVDLRGPGADVQAFHVHHCAFKYNKFASNAIHGDSLAPAYARAGVLLHRAVVGTVERCHFDKCKNLLVLGDENSSSYVNAVHVVNCAFNDCLPDPDAGQVLIAANDLNICTIQDSTFSGGTSSGYKPIRGTNEPAGHAHDVFNDQSTNRCTGLVISGNYMSDGSAIPALIDGLNSFTNVRPIVISGNFFGSGGAGPIVRAGAGEEAHFGTGPPQFVFFGNAGHGPDYTFGSLEPLTRQYVVTCIGAAPSFVPGQEPARLEVIGRNANKMTGHLRIGADSEFNELDYTTIDSLNFGPNLGSSDPLVDLSPGAWMYLKTYTGAQAGQRLTLQGQTDGSNAGDGVQLMGRPGGVTTPLVRTSGDGLGFFNVDPVGRQTLGSAVSASVPAAGSAISGGEPPTEAEFNSLQTQVNNQRLVLNELKTLANNNRTALVNLGLGQT